MIKIKEQLYMLCVDYIKSHEADIRRAISEAQDAANEETKSSAGDKFETGREVMQQEINLNLARLNELNKQKNDLKRIIPSQKNTTIVPGSLASTNHGNYYIAISAGVLKMDNVTYYAISASSPIGTKLGGLKTKDEFTFNGKNFVIESVG